MNPNKLLPGEYKPVVDASWSFRQLVGRLARLIPSEGEKILFVEAEELGGPPGLVPAMFRLNRRAGRAGPMIVPERDEADVSFMLLVAVKDDLVQLEESDEDEELEVHLNRLPKYKKIKQYPSKKTQKRTAEPAPEEEESEEEDEEEEQSCSSSSVLHVKRSRRVRQYGPRKIRAAAEEPGTSSALVPPRKRSKSN